MRGGLLDRVIVCGTCAGGAGFAAALRDAGVDGVETVACMNQCDRPVTLAFRAKGKDAYLFAGIDPVADLADALALVRLYAEAPGGTIADARPAGRLRYCLVGRIPG
ncbi:MAG: DUF1636 domain-containing protein [Rhodobacter sp.]|nr:DUF1636 domain-containing protein [Rhodobacter sp.]